MRQFVVSLLLLGGLLAVPASVGVQAAPGCAFTQGFAALHDLISAVVGVCTDDETHNPANGDALQHTTTGLLVWRKADNFTAFTDGATTWVNGPAGIQERPNGQRFPWEANPDGLPLVNGGTTVPGPSGGDRCTAPLGPPGLPRPLCLPA